MNSGENSNSLNLSKNTLQQKKLDYFRITGNFVQGKACLLSKLSKTNNTTNDGARLKEHIITPTHIGKSQESRSKRMCSTFLTSFFNRTKDNNTLETDNNFIDLTESADDNDYIVLISQRNQNQKLLEMTSKDSKQYVCNGFFRSEYAVFAKYGTSILDQKIKVKYTILRNDDLYDGLNRAG
ncbi:15105_t:CDS:2, partial [Funneliformis caledonium]